MNGTEQPVDNFGNSGNPEIRPYYIKIVIENLPYTYNNEKTEKLVNEQEGFVKSYEYGKNFYAFFETGDQAKKCIEYVNKLVIEDHELKASYARNLKNRDRNGITFEKHFDEFYDVNLISYQTAQKKHQNQNMDETGNSGYQKHFSNQIGGDRRQYHDYQGMPDDGMMNMQMGNRGYYNRMPENRYMDNGNGNGNDLRGFNNQNMPQGNNYGPNNGMHNGPQGNGRYMHNQYQRNYDPSRQTGQRFNVGGRVRSYEGRDSGMGGYSYGSQGNSQNNRYSPDQLPNGQVSPMDYGSQQRNDRIAFQQRLSPHQMDQNGSSGYVPNSNVNEHNDGWAQD